MFFGAKQVALAVAVIQNPIYRKTEKREGQFDRGGKVTRSINNIQMIFQSHGTPLFTKQKQYICKSPNKKGMTKHIKNN